MYMIFPIIALISPVILIHKVYDYKYIEKIHECTKKFIIILND